MNTAWQAGWQRGIHDAASGYECPVEALTDTELYQTREPGGCDIEAYVAYLRGWGAGWAHRQRVGLVALSVEAPSPN